MILLFRYAGWDIPKTAEVAQYLDENRKETNRYYYRQYEHHADYSFADPDYVDAHSFKLGESPESVLIRREAYAALEHALRKLTDDQRRRLFLRTEKNWTFEQIAAAEGVSADAVRHQFERTVRSYTRRTMKNREEKRMREM